MLVEISGPAENDLLEISRFIARDNPDRALTFVTEIEAACLGLGELPKRYPLLEIADNTEIRRRPFGNYLILYRIESAKVMIVRIVNGAMDIEKLLDNL